MIYHAGDLESYLYFNFQFCAKTQILIQIVTRRAETKKAFAVLREHSSNGTCLIGAPYRPKPQLRPDKDFHTCIHSICSRAEQDLLRLMILQPKRNISADTKAHKETLATIFPDKNKPNGGSGTITADPLSEAARSNHQPDTSKTQLTNLFNPLLQRDTYVWP